MKHLNNKIRLGLLIVIGLALTSCGGGTATNQKQTPPLQMITDNGVEPFLLQSNAKDIPTRGEWYDTILTEETYEVMYGFHMEVVTLSAEEYKQWENDEMFMDVISHDYMLSVMRGEECLLRAYSDMSKRNRNIRKIEVLSSKLALENGIRVGMKIEEVAERARVKLYQVGLTATDAHLIAADPINSSVEINLADINRLTNIYFDGDDETLLSNWKEIDEERYELPVSIDNGDTISSIVITKQVTSNQYN